MEVIFKNTQGKVSGSYRAGIVYDLPESEAKIAIELGKAAPVAKKVETRKATKEL